MQGNRGLVMTIYERIKKRRKELGLSADKVALALGVSRATVYRYESSEIEKVPASVIKPLARILQTTPEYLMGWEAASNSEDLQSFDIFPAENMVDIPIIGKVSAGFGNLACEEIESVEPVSADSIKSGDTYFFLRIKGDSMSPLFLENDLVLVRRQSSIDSGSYGVVLIDEEDGMVKKIKYGPDWIELHSENPYYPVRRFENEDVLRIRVVGLVTEVKRKLIDF